MSSSRSRLFSLVTLAVLAAGSVYLLSSGESPEAGASPEDLRTPKTTAPAPTTEPQAPPSDSPQAGSPSEETATEAISTEDELRNDDSGVARADPPEHEGAPPLRDYEPMTLGALDFPDMKGLDPTDPAYDPHVEAQQAFAPMERDLLDAEPLDAAAWRGALERHKLRNAGVSRRAQFLRESGHPELAEDLIIEWGRVYGSWQARAYGRAGPPGYKSPPR